MEIIKDEVSKYAVLNKEKIFIVLSSSMPDHAIKEYFKRLDGIEGVDFVFRGILHNDLKSFRPMMEYIQFILKKIQMADMKNQIYIMLILALIQKLPKSII